LTGGTQPSAPDDDKNDTEDNGYLFERHFSSDDKARTGPALADPVRADPKARAAAIRPLRSEAWPGVKPERGCPSPGLTAPTPIGGRAGAGRQKFASIQ
jgi:hypothetical protein